MPNPSKNIAKIEHLNSSGNPIVRLSNKNFKNETFDKIRLENSIIRQCDFEECKLYNNEFTGCDFNRVNFLGSSIAATQFKSCQFFNVSFMKVSMTYTSFDENCNFYDCNFTDLEKGEGVVGLNADDQSIITEKDDDSFATAFKKAGFEDLGDGSYEFKIGQYIKAVAYFDPDVKNWRITYFANNESIYTVDLYNKVKNDVMGKVKDDLEFVKDKISDKEKYDDMDGEIAEIEEYLKAN